MLSLMGSLRIVRQPTGNVPINAPMGLGTRGGDGNSRAKAPPARKTSWFEERGPIFQ